MVRLGGDGNAAIVALDRVRLTDQSIPPVTIASTAGGFTQIGQSPSISRYDEAIAFYANLDPAGATALGTNSGAGIFVSIKEPNGQRKIVRIAGRLVEDNSAPGGNDDGVCDSGETCVLGELGVNQAGSRIYFNSFDPNQRIDVAYIPSGQPGLLDDLVMVSFIATPNIASDIPGRSFSSQQGIWSLTAKISSASGDINSPDKAIPVVQVGTVINGNTITSLSVYDQIANNVERVAFFASSSTGNMIVRAVRDPGTPVIFVAGIGGSKLEEASTGQKWPPESTSSDLTALDINNSVQVDDVVRKFKVSTGFGVDLNQKVYESLLNYLKDNGYSEYDLGGDENRRNATCGGQNINVLQASHPTLFVFPYDWRRTNGPEANGNVTKLKEYIQCVRQIYPDSDVNIVAHSMGGLLSRRYILENAQDHHVKTLITIGTPWLGAPRALHSFETGSFVSEAFPNGVSDSLTYWLPDALWASQIKQIVEGFPGAAELLPSQKYYELGGKPLRVNRVDYDFSQVRNWINSRHQNYNPGSRGELFHSVSAQDDFRSDATGVNYYHIYGKQPSNRTVGRIEPRSRLLAGIILGAASQFVYSDFLVTATEGDGTVPIISSSRRADTGDGLNATCGSANDRRCIGVCYTSNVDSKGELSQHNGMTSNPQVQSQILQILRYSDGLVSQNPSFDPNENCHLPSNSAATSSPSTQLESHYISMTGISNALITDSQGNNNSSVSAAYKKLVPGVTEIITGSNSMQVIAATDNAYTIRFAGTGQLIAIEDIRGVTNEFSNATYIVRYDDIFVDSGVTAELKIVGNHIESLKYDSNGDGNPDTIINPSRIITDPSSADLLPPTATAIWGRLHRLTITATDNASGVRRIYYRTAGQSVFQVVNGSSAVVQVPSLVRSVEYVTEDNAGNRSEIIISYDYQ